MPVRTYEPEQYRASDEVLTPLCHIITPVGMLGYGFDKDIIENELSKLVPTSIPVAAILDSGSTDSGPSKLALGSMTAPRDAYKRDLTKLIRLVNLYKVPLLFSSAGGDGSDAHVDEIRAVIEEIVSEKFSHQEFKALSIYAEVPKSLVKQRLDQGDISGCGSAVPTLTFDSIDSAPTVVAQIGCEAFLDAMFANPYFDIIIGGRAYDPSPYVAYAAYQAMSASKKVPLNVLGEKFLGGAFHMGKIMECGGVCAIPKSHSSRATIYTCGAFDITPLAPGSRCTPLSVAAHTLYEKSRPDLLYGPGGCLDLTSTSYEQLPDNKSVRPHGAVFRPLPTANKKYTVKLEGARVIGYRTIFMGSFRDPILVSQIDHFLSRIHDYVTSQHKDTLATWDLHFHKYGLSEHEHDPGKEVFIVAETLADTQVLANSVASSARIAATHGAYPGQKATSGNFVFGLGGKNEFEAGPCAEFCVYHLMNLEPGEEGARDVTAGSDMFDGSNGTNKSSKLFSFRQDIIGSRSECYNSSSLSFQNGSRRTVQAPTSGRSRSTSEFTKKASSKSNNSTNLETNEIIHDHCKTLGDVASVLRSKNAGPYEITLDVMFDSPTIYQAIKNSNLLNIALISRLYAINEQDVIYCGFFDQALAFKATIPRMRGGRKCASGGYMEDDVQGSGQYLPLMNLRLPTELSEVIRGLQLSSSKI